MSNYVKHKDGTDNLITGGYFVGDRWIVVEMRHDANWTIKSETKVLESTLKKDAEDAILIRTGKTLVLEKRIGTQRL